MKKILFVFLFSWSGLVLGISEEQLLGKYTLYEKHKTVTGVSFGYDYKIKFFKKSNGVFARYQVNGRGVAIDYICTVILNSRKVILTFSKFGEDAEKYGYKDSSKVGDHVLTLIPGNKGGSVYLKAKGELGEMLNPKFYKQ